MMKKKKRLIYADDLLVDIIGDTLKIWKENC